MNEKSELTPSQDFMFIGFRFCTHVGLMFPPQDRIVKILSRIGQLFALKFCQARAFLSLIGLLNSAADQILLNSAADQIPHRRLYLRPLQLLLLSRWRPHQDPLDREIPLPESLLREVSKFWDSEILLNQGVSQSGRVVTTTPSQTFHVRKRSVGPISHVNEVDLTTKSQEESKMSINILELKAVLQGVKHFLKNQRVSLFSDNSTVLSYIRKQVGTHSPVVCRMTWEILQFCRRENIMSHDIYRGSTTYWQTPFPDRTS
jgi:ribonuclease HI